MRRRVWPIWAWATGTMVVIDLVLMTAGLFVDSRFGVYLIPGVILTIVSTLALVGSFEDRITREVKPRGWRKMRREAEREAYIRSLERELFDS